MENTPAPALNISLNLEMESSSLVEVDNYTTSPTNEDKFELAQSRVKRSPLGKFIEGM